MTSVKNISTTTLSSAYVAGKRKIVIESRRRRNPASTLKRNESIFSPVQKTRLSKCQEAIDFYKTLPGFKDFPDNFCIDEITADEDFFNDEVGKFDTKVYFLCHEWYDGEYDYVSHLGYYSTIQKAEQAEERFKLEKEFLEHLEGFGIDEYFIDKLEWSEGFFSWR